MNQNYWLVELARRNSGERFEQKNRFGTLAPLVPKCHEGISQHQAPIVILSAVSIVDYDGESPSVFLLDDVVNTLCVQAALLQVL